MKTVEFRGCDNLVYAEVISDDRTEFVVGQVKVLAPVASISKTVESSSDSKYYDNRAQIIIRSEGSDEVTLAVPVLPLETLATLTGKGYNSATGAYIDGDSVERYFAIGYRLKLTDGTYRYVWRLKGSFNIPDEESSTENDGTDSNNQELTYTGVKTVHEFDNDGSAKAVVVDERDGLCDISSWFDDVVTPDTLATYDTSYITGLSVSPATASLQVGATRGLTATVTVTTGHDPYAGGIPWESTNEQVATVNSNGLVTAVSPGSAIIFAKVGKFTSGCIVTVSAST